MCRFEDDLLEFFLVHPGGPYFRKKDAGWWTIPKGVPEPHEDLLVTAQREFFEETGIRASAPYLDIGNIRQKGGKIVHAWAFSGNWKEGAQLASNTSSIEWPPRSGNTITFPEVDQARWFNYQEATNMIVQEQLPFLDRARIHFGS